MSENSKQNSVSYQDLFSRMKRTTKVAAPVKTDAVSVSYSRGNREITKYGFERYNIDDSEDIYISKAPESALFNDGEPILTKAESGLMVGKYTPAQAARVEVVPMPVRSVSDMFGNVDRGTDKSIDAFIG